MGKEAERRGRLMAPIKIPKTLYRNVLIGANFDDKSHCREIEGGGVKTPLSTHIYLYKSDFQSILGCVLPV